MASVLLCCVDSSDAAVGVARVAGGLAERLGLEPVLLHVAAVTTRPGVSAAPAGQERLEEIEREEAAALLERVARESGLPAETKRRVEVGDAVSATLAVAEELDAELLVLGSRGRGGLKRAFLGSVSRDVAGRASCIVVVVPPAAAERTMLRPGA